MSVSLRYYTKADYDDLTMLYKTSDEFEFDVVTDSRQSLSRKIESDPESIVLAYQGEDLIGSVSLVEDGRIAILFRLVVRDNNSRITKELILHAEKILSKRGYKEVHITGPAENQTATEVRESSGFRKGKRYDWFWKKIAG